MTTANPAVTVFQPARSLARYAATGARIVLGLVFFVFGLDGFLHFMPQPTEMPTGDTLAFLVGLMKSGYMLPLVKGTEVFAGVLLLANRFVPLALAVLAPVVVNIFAFHAFLAPEGMAMAGGIVALQLYLAYVNRSAYRPLFVAAWK